MCMCMYFLTWKRISFDAECMRAWEKNERYLRNPHTSGTRKRCSEQVVQFFGTVKFEAKGLLQFLLAPSCTLIASTRFRIYAFFLSTSSNKKRARPVVTEPENFADRSRMRVQLLLPSTILSSSPLFSFIRNLSHSSSPRFVKAYLPFIVEHDTDILTLFLPTLSYFRNIIGFAQLPLPLLFFNCFFSLFQLVPLSL